MIAQSLEFLAREYRVHLLYFARDPLRSNAQAPNWLETVEPLPLATGVSILKNVVFRPGRTLQEALFFTPEAERRIVEFVEKFSPSLVVADMLRTAQYVENLNLPKLCELDDLLSVRYERALSVSGFAGDVTGTFGQAVPRLLRMALNGLLQRLVLRIEGPRVRRREAEIASQFSAVTLVSPVEADALRACVPSTCVLAVPPGVSLVDGLGEPSQHSNSGPCKLLYVGNLKTHQNRLSLEWIIDEILPRLEATGLDFELVVAGAYDETIRQISLVSPRLKLLGFVEDLGSLYSEATLLLSPIRLGTGIKLKILEALANGLPVVTNSVGIEGIPGVPGEHFLVQEAPEEISSAVVKLCLDQSERSRISLSGKRLVEEHFLIDRIRERFLALTRQLIEDAVSHSCGNVRLSSTFNVKSGG